MTVTSQNYRNDYLGSNPAIAGPYAYTFRITASSDILVVTADTSGNIKFLTLGTDYTITGVGQSGGAITLTVPLATNWALTIVRNQPLLQPTSFANQGPIYPASIEAALDNLTMQTQTLYDLLNRSIKLPAVTPPAVPFEFITNLPTTLAGYGITDGVSTTAMNAAIAAAVSGLVTTSAMTAAIAAALVPYRTKSQNDGLYASIADDTIPMNWNLPWGQVTGAPNPVSISGPTPWTAVDETGAAPSFSGQGQYYQIGTGTGSIIILFGSVEAGTTADGSVVQIGGIPPADTGDGVNFYFGQQGYQNGPTTPTPIAQAVIDCGAIGGDRIVFQDMTLGPDGGGAYLTNAQFWGGASAPVGTNFFIIYISA